MEVVKFQQAQLINADLDMYYAPSDTPALCRTSSLVEELGQIEFVFSDKTGTLTRNEMEFKKCSIAGIPYADVAEEGGEEEEGTRTFEELQGLLYGDAGKSVGTGAIEDREREVAREFMALLAVCHTVIPEVRDGKTHYQASSPDEAALVAGAEMLGYQFHVGRPFLIKCCFTHSL
jgi:phospholipid-transporting ATPase